MTTLYLTPKGCDSWSGRLAQPAADQSDGPLASPGAALLAARRCQAETRQPVQVLVIGGYYELAEPLVFTPEDNGQVWSAAPGTRVVFSGGRRLTGWQVAEFRGQVCWILDLPEVCRNEWNFTQLWVNGERRVRPRLPKTGYYSFSGLDGQTNSGFAFGRGPVRAQYRVGDIQAFRNLEDVSLVSYQLWFDTHHRIKAVDESAHVVHFWKPSIGSLVDEQREFARYALFNVYEALCEPGEWYLDRKEGRLYYLPMPGESIDQVEIVAPRLTELVRFQSTADRAVADVRLENLVLVHNEWSRGKDTVGTVQAAFDVPGAVIFDRAERCVLYGCEISHCAGYGIEMLTGSHANVVAACAIHDLGGGGVKIGHESLVVHESAVGASFAPEARWFRRMAATVADCAIYDGGHVYPSAIGIWIGNAGENRIQHNEIHHFNYTGISFGWIWGFNSASRGFDNRIENNHIHHINAARILSDNGGIYSLGLQTGSVVTGNHIHDVACHGYGGWGLYPDEGSSGILYRDNCVHDVQDCGVCIHYGRFLTIRNNLFVCVGGDVVGLGREDLSCGNLFESNVLWFDRGNLGARANANALTHATRRNLVWNGSPGGVRWPLGTLEAEQAAGRWIDSVEADPRLSNPKGGDSTMSSDSPALQLGFVPFDWQQAGPRSSANQPLSFEEYRLPEAAPIAAAVARFDDVNVVEQGMGCRVEATLRVENISRLTVAGTCRVVARTAQDTSQEWPVVAIPINLAPGAAISRPISLEWPAGQQLLWLFAQGDEHSLFSGAIVIRNPVKIDVPDIARSLANGKSSEEALGAGRVVEMMYANRPLLSGRMAVADDRLMLQVTVAEKDPQPDDRAPWMASSVEVFLAPEISHGLKTKPAQFFVLPPVSTKSGQILAASGNLPDGITFRADLTPEGWSFELSLPLRELGIPVPVKVFRIDLICNVKSPMTGQNMLHVPLWGTTSDHTDANLLARVTVAGSNDSKGQTL